MSTFFCFLAILQVLQCAYFIVQVFDCFPAYSSSKSFVAHFLPISVFFLYYRSYSVPFSFLPFSVFLAIFHLLQCVFLISWFTIFFAIFQVLQFCISNFPRFSLFLAIIQVLQCFPLIFHVFNFSPQSDPTFCISHFLLFQCFMPYFMSYSVHFSFSMIFSFLDILQDLKCAFPFFSRFSIFLAIFHFLQCGFFIFHDFLFSRVIPGPTVCISHFPTY